MRNIKLLVLMGVFSFGISYSQDKNTLELVKLFHDNDIKDISTEIFNFTTPTLKEKKNKEEELDKIYENLSIVYNNKFNEAEIKELVKLYKTELGKKLKTYNPNIINEAEGVILNWRLSHNAISNEENISLDLEAPISSNGVTNSRGIIKSVPSKLKNKKRNSNTTNIDFPIITDEIILNSGIPEIKPRND